MPQRLIVVVDQSGSMTDSMVNCTILASIFAGLRCVDVHLIAYDTQALDLTLEDPSVLGLFPLVARENPSACSGDRYPAEEVRVVLEEINARRSARPQARQRSPPVIMVALEQQLAAPEAGQKLEIGHGILHL